MADKVEVYKETVSPPTRGEAMSECIRQYGKAAPFLSECIDKKVSATPVDRYFVLETLTAQETCDGKVGKEKVICLDKTPAVSSRKVYLHTECPLPKSKETYLQCILREYGKLVQNPTKCPEK